jgi:hypothetical protein
VFSKAHKDMLVLSIEHEVEKNGCCMVELGSDRIMIGTYFGNLSVYKVSQKESGGENTIDLQLEVQYK